MLDFKCYSYFDRESPSTPLSPSLLSRKDEKDQMINLNNRMAVYVEKVRSLETENEGLRIRVSSFEQTSSNEVICFSFFFCLVSKFLWHRHKFCL